MTPDKAHGELARVARVVRTTGRRLGAWAGVAVALPALAVLLAAGFLLVPAPGAEASPVPMMLAVVALSAAGAAGLSAGWSLRACGWRRSLAAVEDARGLARGELRGAFELEADPAGSSSLATLQRARVAARLSGATSRELLPRASARVRLARLVAIPALGSVLAIAAVGRMSEPESISRSVSALARPWALTFPPPPPAMAIDPPGGEVLRGAFFEASIAASNRTRVLFGQSRPGKPTVWDTLPVVGGVAEVRIGPVDETVQFWARDDRGARTDTFAVVPLDPLTLTDLSIDLDYPDYLGRASETMNAPITTLSVPAGTRLAIEARANHPLSRLGLARHGLRGTDTTWLDTTDREASGGWVVRDSALLEWLVVASPGVPGIRPPPDIALSVQPDRPPRVAIAHPGEDSFLGFDRSLSLVVEAADDHGLAAVGLTWWRQSPGRLRHPPEHAPLIGEAGARRLTLRPVLDFSGSDLLPGDEVVYFATAADARPGAPVSVSDTFRARLTAVADMSDAMGRRAGALVEETRSLRGRAGDLADAARDAERRSSVTDPISSNPAPASTRPAYEETQEARRLLEEARDLEDELTRKTEQLEEARADLAGVPVPDPALERRLRELHAAMQEVRQSDLRNQILALEEALRGPDRADLSDALSDLSRRSRGLEERLDRALGLMRRVVLEQSLEEARRVAGRLAREQGSDAAGDTGDPSWAGRQEERSSEAEDLADRITDFVARLEEEKAQDAADGGRRAADDVRSAAARMRSAGRPHAGPGDPARMEARSAVGDLESAERELAEAADRLASDWRADAMRTAGRAATGALELAREQQRIVDDLQSGVPPEELSEAQSAVREGLDNVSQSLAEAGRKTALLDRRTGPAAARAGREMDALGQSLAAGEGGRSQAMQRGRSAMEALSELAGALLSSRRAMGEANSATGMEEALERLAGLGRQQAGLNSESGELFLLMQSGRPAADRLNGLSNRQQAVSQGLRQLADDVGARSLGQRPEELAREADEIARRLDSGRLDSATLERQERLFRRLLDAGRSLEREEEDEGRRESTTARPRVALVPAGGSIEEGPRYPYPDERSMEGLTPQQRRLVYGYFDRLNREATEDRP